MNAPLEIKKGVACWGSKPKNIEYIGLPNPREWSPFDEDWKLPENWRQIVLDGLRERLERFRSLKIFMDVCVRCGACADKCHFFIGGGDPKNMPVLRAELLRSVYRREYSRAGKLLGRLEPLIPCGAPVEGFEDLGREVIVHHLLRRRAVDVGQHPRIFGPKRRGKRRKTSDNERGTDHD